MVTVGIEGSHDGIWKRSRVSALSFSARSFSALRKAMVPVLLVIYGALLFRGESEFRETLAFPLPLSEPIVAEPVVRAPFNASALVSVLGLAEQSALARSAEPLQLRAIFISSSGLSRALLAGANGARIYRVGERLPGGSVLRRVEGDRAVLWRHGREEVLTLGSDGERSPLLFQADSQGAAAASSPLFLRPVIDKRQSN